jgi:cytochrome c oxidase subunit 4
MNHHTDDNHNTNQGEHTPLQTQGLTPNLANPDTVEGEQLHPGHDHHEHHVHVTPFWPMAATFIALIFLTVLTVLTAQYLYLGNAVNLVIALAIAGLKALLVAAFFMHLLYDKPLNTIVVVATMFATVLFISITVIDMGTRDLADKTEAGEIVPGGGAQVSVDEETGKRTVSRIGSYQPWYTDTPSKSIVDIARENAEAKDAHAGEDHQDSADTDPELPADPPNTGRDDASVGSEADNTR